MLTEISIPSEQVAVFNILKELIEKILNSNYLLFYECTFQPLKERSGFYRTIRVDNYGLISKRSHSRMRSQSRSSKSRRVVVGCSGIRLPSTDSYSLKFQYEWM